MAAGKITGPSVKAFANAPYGESLSIHRNKFDGPGFVNTDLVFQKTQTLREEVKLIFRAESYNILNHPNLNSPRYLSIASPLSEYLYRRWARTTAQPAHGKSSLL